MITNQYNFISQAWTQIFKNIFNKSKIFMKTKFYENIKEMK